MSAAVPPGYKQTEVGVIPEDWEVSTVGAEFTVQLGKMLDAEKNLGVAKPFLGNRAVQWGRIDLTDIGTIRLTPSDLQRFRLRDGDLLVCEGGEVGRAAIWTQPLEECYYQKALHRLRPTRRYSPKLMLNVLQYLASIGFLLNYVTQTSIAHLPKDKFETVPIPLPSTELEQQAIAEALSDADALIEGLEALITKKRQLKQGTIRELLRPKDGWHYTSLGNLGFTFGGLIGKTKGDLGQGEAKYITFMNIMTNVVIDSRAFANVRVSPTESQNQVIRGDLLFNGSSETPEEVGMCSVLLENVSNTFLNSFCFGFRLRRADLTSGLYLAYFSRSGEGRGLLKSLAQGATRYNLSKTSLLRLEFRIPNFEEQTAIAAILADMDAEIAALEGKLAKARRVKVGMMQDLLTGRVRLV